jgi:GntR family transcriptional regulator
MQTTENSLRPDTRPLYDQAIDALNRFIDQGGYTPGDRLPAEGELAKQLGISRPTLREAMGNLEGQGVILRRHGVGTFVTAPAQGTMQGGLEQLESVRSLADKAGVTLKRADWVVSLVNAPEKIAKILDVEQGTPLARVQMTAQNDECKYAYLDNYVLADCVDLEKLEKFKKGSLVDFLLEQNVLKLSYTHTDLHSVEANAEIARWLNTEEGRPLMLLTETYFTETGSPTAYEYNYFITDSLHFHITRRIIRR